MLPRATCSGDVVLLLLLLLPLGIAKLLRINEWYSLTLPPLSTASLQMNLFYSCDSASMLIKTGRNSMTHMHFFFDGDLLEQMDVDSTRLSTFPQTHRVLGGCREVDRKVLTVNVSSSYDYFEIRVDGQIFRRPKARTKPDEFEIALPQESACCIIRAVLSTDSGASTIEVVTPTTREPPRINERITATTTTAPMRRTTLPERRVTPRQHRTRPQKNVPPTTSSHEYKLYSWTDVVNREWSMTFIITAALTCAMMTGLILFGVIACLWLLSKPKDAGLMYRVETPGLY